MEGQLKDRGSGQGQGDARDGGGSDLVQRSRSQERTATRSLSCSNSLLWAENGDRAPSGVPIIQGDSHNCKIGGLHVEGNQIGENHVEVITVDGPAWMQVFASEVIFSSEG